MTLQRSVLVLMAGLSMAGCSMLGLHKKDSETPTQVALSLYAAPDVNPNPDALTPDPSAPTQQTPDVTPVTVDARVKEGPYLVNLTGTSKAELAEKMRALLDYLQTAEPGQHAPQTALQATPAASVPATAPSTTPPTTQTGAATDKRGTLASIGIPVATATVGAPVTTGVTKVVTPHVGSTGQTMASAAGGVTGVWAGSKLQGPVVASGPPLPHAQTTAPTSTTVAAPMPASAAVPILLTAGTDSRASDATSTHAKAPALGQYADGPPGLTLQRDESNGANVATPVAFKIVQLKDDSLFLNADPDTLLKDLKKTLGNTYVDDDDYVLQPGQFKYIEFKKIDKATRFLAVLANFHDQGHATSKQVLRVEAGGFKYSVLVILHNIDVGMVDESYHQPPRTKS